ncbi:MAG: DUF5693 family protein [Candidatus Onthomonas sp.]
MKRGWSLLLVAMLLVLTPFLAQRWQWEAENQTVALLFDGQALEELARNSGIPLEQWLETLKEQGLTGLALREETLETLKERSALTWLTRTQALASPYWTSAYPEPVQAWLTEAGEGVLIALWEQDTAQWLSEALTDRELSFETVAENGMIYLLLEGEEELAKLPLGLWPETVELARKQGLTVCPVLSLTEEENNLALAKSLYREWKEEGVATVICQSGGLPGWEESPREAEKLLQDYTSRGGSLALVESSAQRGSLDFPGKEAVTGQEGRLLRCFYQWDYVSDRYAALGYKDSREVSMALARAAAERNCRLLWLRPMTDSESGKTVEDLGAYVTLLQQLNEDLDRFGLSVGEARPGAWISGLPALAAQILSWLTAAGTGCLCGWLLLSQRRSWGLVACAQLTALAGGLAASVWLSGSSFFLGEEIFRGVKLAQLLPLALFLLLWVRRQWISRRSALDRWLERPVQGKTLLLGAAAGTGILLLLGVGVYYLARTGNSGLATDLELRVRNTLEEWFTVRPRFKEFALGLPCLTLWCKEKLPRWAEPVIGLGAMVGLVSVTNTFLHLCTPLRLSLIRTGAGWLLGGVFALALLGLVRLGRRLLWHAS